MFFILFSEYTYWIPTSEKIRKNSVVNFLYPNYLKLTWPEDVLIYCYHWSDESGTYVKIEKWRKRLQKLPKQEEFVIRFLAHLTWKSYELLLPLKWWTFSKLCSLIPP